MMDWIVLESEYDDKSKFNLACIHRCDYSLGSYSIYLY